MSDNVTTKEKKPEDPVRITNPDELPDRRFPNDFITPDVMRQLNIRSRIMGRDPSLKNGNIDEVNNLFLQNKLFNTGWVSLISSVDNFECNAVGGPYEKELLAKNFVLSGGSLIWDNVNKVLRKREGINFTDPLNKSGAYNLSLTSGFKPMPGITDFSITSQGSQGLLRNASIKFTVWTLEELDLMERLYFRPGYHMILEWGHTTGISNEIEIINSLSLLTDSFEDYFQPNNRYEIFRKILEKQRKLDYNYDGTIGIITNFEFSFRKDLGYDCTLRVTSLSQLAESFTVKTGTPDTNKIVADGQQSPDFSAKGTFLSSIVEIYETIPLVTKNNGAEKIVTVDSLRLANYESLERVSRLLSNVHEKRLNNSKPSILRFSGDIQEDLTLENEVILDPNPNYYGIVKTIEIDEGDNGKASNVIGYMPLKVLFYFINQFIEDTFQHDKTPLYDINFDTEFTTFGNHSTLDPLAAFLPTRPTNEKLYPLIGNVQKVSAFYKNEPTKNVFSCLDIHVSTRVLEKLLENFNKTSSDPANSNMARFVTTVLDEISTALGSFNQFVTQYDEVTNRFHIVDKGTQPNRVAKSQSKLEDTTFTVAGIRALASDLNLKTVINSSLASVFSAAASGEDASSNNSSFSSFKSWNEFLVDRFSPPPPGTLTSIAIQKNCDGSENSFLDKYYVNQPTDDSPCGGYSSGVLSSDVGAYIDKTPWSAGFISSIMKESNVPFPFSAAHTDYAQRIRTNPLAYPGWQVLDPRTAVIKVGDVIIQNRAKNTMTNARNPWTGASHGDIVVAVSGNSVNAIGGNVSDKVENKGFNTNGGRLSSTNFFAVLRPPPTYVPSIVSNASTEWGIWLANRWTEKSPEAYTNLKKYYDAGNLNLPPFTPPPPCIEEVGVNGDQTLLPPLKPSQTFIPGITPDFLRPQTPGAPPNLLGPKIPSSNPATPQQKTGGYKPAVILPTPAFAWKNDTAFIEGVNKLSQKYDIDANDLLSLFASESQVNPAKVNEKTRATGLIQFMPDTARELGTSVEILARMSRVQQLQFVDKYFKKWSLPKGAGAGQMYATVFLPGRSKDEILTNRSEKYYTYNTGLDLNNDGFITRAELDIRMERKKKEFGIAPKSLSPATNPPILSPPPGLPPGIYNPNLNTNEADIQAEKLKNRAIIIGSFISVYERLMTSFREGGYVLREWDDLKNDGENIFKDTINMSDIADGKPPNGLLPIELSFQIDGIGGIKLFECFMLQKGLLPDRYGGVAFCITGIDNAIAGNRWTTTVKALSFKYIRPLKTDQEEAKKVMVGGFFTPG